MRSPKGKNKPQTDTPKGGALAFKILPEDVTKRLLDCSDPKEVEGHVAEFLNITDHEVNLKSAALLDYFVSAVLWSRERGHNPEQLSSVYSVVHNLLESVKPPEAKSLLESIDCLKAMLADVGGEDVTELSGGLERLGGVAEAEELVTYITKTFFQHYSLFQFLFERSPAEDILGCDLMVEVAPCTELPPFPPPLPEGMPEELHKLLIEPPTSAKPSREASAVSSKAEETPADGDGAEKKAGEAVDLDAIFQELTPDQVKRIVEEVCREELAGVERDVAMKLREKENEFIGRINKVHKVAPE